MCSNPSSPSNAQSSLTEKAVTIVAAIMWLSMFVFVLDLLNRHFMVFVGITLFVDEKGFYDYLIQALNLVATFVYGQIVFSLFLLPGKKFYLPPVEVRTNILYMVHFALLCLAAAAFVAFLNQTTNLIFEVGWKMSMLAYVSSGLVSLYWILWQLYLFVSSRRNHQLYELDLPSLNKEAEESKILLRLRKKLSTLEREELIDTLYKRETLSKVTVQSLASIIWMTLVLMFLGELAQELFSRI